jgi:hypothetical protein
MVRPMLDAREALRQQCAVLHKMLLQVVRPGLDRLHCHQPAVDRHDNEQREGEVRKQRQSSGKPQPIL